MPAPPIGSMPQFGALHLLMLLVIAVLCVVVVRLGRWLRGREQEHTVTRLAGWTALALAAAWTAWGMLPMNWTVEHSLPLHYSDALRLVTAIALITRAGWAIAISYFWGLTLNTQAILTPDLLYFQLPVLEFLAYWASHGAALLTPLLLVWGLGYRPTWRGYAAALLGTLLWAGLATSVNLVTGANYGYLTHAPEGRSILDLLGGWPIYLLWELVLVSSVWALMTWPWTVRSRRDAPIADRWATVRRAEAERGALVDAGAPRGHAGA